VRCVRWGMEVFSETVPKWIGSGGFNAEEVTG
jgi:hypothetical protein